MNASADEIDRSTFNWIGMGALNPAEMVKVPPCGACHPGSASMEYVRDANGEVTMARLDEVVVVDNTLDGDFRVGIGANDPPAENMFTVTGVVEGDCLLCHLVSGYNFGLRFKQLTYRNYKWAATAASGLGAVSGKIYTFDDTVKSGFKSGTWIEDTNNNDDLTDEAGYPMVAYDPDNNPKIEDDGGLQLVGSMIMETPTATQCLFCHAGSDSKKRGLKWASEKDVHNKAGLDCLDCHGMAGDDDIDHNFGKGYARLGSVANDLDGTMKHNCVSCHLGAVEEDHIEYFGGRLHMDRISCEGCHISYMEDNMGYLIDMSSGNQIWMTRDGRTPRWAGDFGKIVDGFTWRPFLKLYDPDGNGAKYYPFGSKSSTWFGFIAPGGHVQPYILRHVKAAYDTLKGDSVLANPTVPVTFPEGADPATGMKPNISDPDDIVAMLTELEDNGPVAGAAAVFVTAEHAYQLDAVGTGLVDSGIHGETDHNFSINHNVRPADEALGAPTLSGAKGCADCHSADGALANTQITDVSGFLSSRMSDLDMEAIETNGEPMYVFAGLSEEQGQELLDIEDDGPNLGDDDNGSSSECFIGALGGAPSSSQLLPLMAVTALGVSVMRRRK